MGFSVDQIYRYPVKGLSPEKLARTTLVAGQGIAGDRRFAIAHGSTMFDAEAPAWMPKHNFLMLAKNERLALLQTVFDDATGTLTIERNGRQVVRADISTQTGRTLVEQFFAAFMGSESRGSPKLVEAPGHMFSDTARKVVSIIGLSSIADIARVARAPVDPLRFRANLYLAGTRAWEEFEWLGREIAVGAARLRVLDRIDRCPATGVNPATAQRDMNVPRLLQDGFRHIDCGVFAEIVAGGEIAPGDEVALA